MHHIIIKVIGTSRTTKYAEDLGISFFRVFIIMLVRTPLEEVNLFGRIKRGLSKDMLNKRLGERYAVCIKILRSRSRQSFGDIGSQKKVFKLQRLSRYGL